jgi:hypothetical protein
MKKLGKFFNIVDTTMIEVGTIYQISILVDGLEFSKQLRLILSIFLRQEKR